MAELPNIMTAAGLLPLTPAQIRQKVIDNIAIASPDLAVTLPASPLNAMLDTAVYSLVECNRDYVECVNSITPYAMNEYILNQWSFLMGITRNQFYRSSVYVEFTGTVGYVIGKGFLVSDGIHQFEVSNGGIIQTIGKIVLYCICTNDDSFAIPANTVNQIVTSVYSPIVLTCNNLTDGFIGQGQESSSSFRARCFSSLQRTSTGTVDYAKDLLRRVAGVDPRLVSIKSNGGATKVICGGGDKFEVSDAIFKSGLDISRLIGSNLDTGRNITASIDNYPDIYRIIFVNPPAQKTAIHVVWNTLNTNFISDLSVAELSSIAITDYINALPVAYKINTLELARVFEESIAAVINRQFISKVEFFVSIDDVYHPADMGSHMVSGDSEGYFYTTKDLITLSRG